MDGTESPPSSPRVGPDKAPVLVISGIWARPTYPAKVDRLGNAKFLRKQILVSEVRKAVCELLGDEA